MTILLIVIAIAFWLLGRLRDYTTHDHQVPSGGLVNLEEMLRKGDISEEEFRTIQSSTRSQVVSSPSTKIQPVRSTEPSSEFSKD
ncbi:putative membrane protein [Rhodopirellula rubra]|uniref:Putative membrane protein n=1 Tax=Aporhodopirellula rubra TaxID=980271 RepID=A0A7W5E2R8_9BACT|nr:signal peptide protein [Rhodopirellula sp. SWK7]MBB3208513.1 putative membrane protein [Aporhodopirellula rubra]